MEAATKLPDSKTGDNHAVCPWLTEPLDGRLFIEGRARLPEGYALPEVQHGFALTWRKVGDLWHFRGQRWGDLSDAHHALCLAWLDYHPRRVDRVTYEAPAELEDGDNADFATLRVARGEPVAVDALDTDEGARGVAAYFGQAMTLGPWSRNGEGWRAPVVGWCP